MIGWEEEELPLSRRSAAKAIAHTRLRTGRRHTGRWCTGRVHTGGIRASAWCHTHHVKGLGLGFRA